MTDLSLFSSYPVTVITLIVPHVRVSVLKRVDIGILLKKVAT